MKNPNQFWSEAIIIAFGIASTAALLNGHSFAIIPFIITFVALAIALYDDDSIPVKALKAAVGVALVFFYPIPGLLYLIGVGLPFLTKDPAILSLKGLLFPLFALTLRGGEFLFTRESISYALTLFGAYMVLLNPEDKRFAIAGLLVSIIASATLRTFTFMFPAQLLLLVTFFKSPPQMVQFIALAYLIISSFSGFSLYIYPFIKAVNDEMIRWLTP